MHRIAIIMGSDSDLPIAEKAAAVLKDFSVPFSVRVMSAHRTPEEVASFASSAREEGFGIIIAIAGKAAHLAGVIAAHTTLPVVAVPAAGSTLGGLDALLSSTEMPPGIPVASVGISSGTNAALLALEMLAVSEQELAAKLDEYRKDLRRKVAQKDKDISSRF